MLWPSILRFPGSVRSAIASINQGTGALNSKVRRTTALGREVDDLLKRIRDLVVTARAASVRTAINTAHLKNQVDLGAVKADQQRQVTQN